MSAQTQAPPKRQALKRLQCPNCGSPINQFTPDAQTVICPSCGSHVALGMEEAEILSKGRKLPAPEVPIEIGKLFTLSGTSYFVLGRVMYEGWDDEDRWRWNEWLLGTQDGRLLWMSYDENGFTVFKKMRFKQPFNPQADSALPIGEGRNVAVHERYPARVLGAEGELTMRVKAGERLYVAEAFGHGKRYSIQQTDQELEVHEGDPLEETAVAQAFNDPAWVERIKKRTASRGFWRSVGVACIWFALLGLVGVGLASQAGETVSTQQVTISRANPVAQIPIDFPAANRPAEITVSAMASIPENTTIDVDTSIISPDNVEDFLFTLELWHETGTDDEGFWREQRTTSSNMFVPHQAGAHTLEVELGAEGTLDSMQINVRVERNRMNSFWLIAYSVCAGIAGIVLIFVASPGLRKSTGSALASDD